MNNEVSKLISRLYQGAADDNVWESAVLDLLAITECRLAFISTVNAHEGHYQQTGTRLYGAVDENVRLGMIEYFTARHNDDLTLAYAAKNPGGRFCDSRQVYPHEDYLKHPYIVWNKSRFDSTHWYIGYSITPDGLTFGVSIHSRAAAVPMSESAILLFQMLFDHMDNAVRLAARPSQMIAASEAQFFLGRNGHVFEMSPKAKIALNELAPALTIENGRLEATAPAGRGILNEAIFAVANAIETGSPGTAVRIPRPLNRASLPVILTPLEPIASPAYAFQPKILLRIIEPVASCVLPFGGALFGLTARESELAALILAGHSPESAAAVLKISRNTIRVHLQTIYGKTGATRQADLVRILMSTLPH